MLKLRRAKNLLRFAKKTNRRSEESTPPSGGGLAFQRSSGPVAGVPVTQAAKTASRGPGEHLRPDLAGKHKTTQSCSESKHRMPSI